MSRFWDEVREAAEDNRLALKYTAAISGVIGERQVKVSEIAGALVHNLAAVIAASCGEAEWKEAAERLHIVLRTRLEHLSGCGLH